jgi:hypothetical protein
MVSSIVKRDLGSQAVKLTLQYVIVSKIVAISAGFLTSTEMGWDEARASRRSAGYTSCTRNMSS